jgi:hypothetical protein
MATSGGNAKCYRRERDRHAWLVWDTHIATSQKWSHWADGVAAKNDYLGGHRTIHEHATDTGDRVRDFFGPEDSGSARFAGACAAAGTAVADTFYTSGRQLVSKMDYDEVFREVARRERAKAARAAGGAPAPNPFLHYSE